MLIAHKRRSVSCHFFGNAALDCKNILDRLLISSRPDLSIIGRTAISSMRHFILTGNQNR